MNRGDIIGRLSSKLKQLIKDNLYFHIEAFDTAPENSTYEIWECIAQFGGQSYDLLNDDINYFFSIDSFCEVSEEKISFKHEFITYLTEKTEQDFQSIFTQLKSKLTFVLSPPKIYPANALLLGAFTEQLESYNVKKAIFRNINFYSVFAVPSKNNDIEVKFLGCKFKKVRHVRTNYQPKWSFDRCIIELFEDFEKKDTLESIRTLTIKDCKIEYLHSDAKEIRLYNIPELNLVCSTDPSQVEFTLKNVHIKYDKNIITKYSFWRNPIFNTFGFGTEDYYKRKMFDNLRAYYCAYLRNPTNDDPIESYRGANIFYDQLTQEPTSVYYTRLEGANLNKYREKELKRGQNNFILTNAVVRRNILNTMRILSARNDLHSEELAITRYYHYFKSRDSVLGRILYWVNEGHYRILRPTIILIISFVIVSILISLEVQNARSIDYIFKPIVLFQDVLFGEFRSSVMETIFSIVNRFIIAIFWVIGFYSVWSLLVAFSRRYGFPLHYADKP